ncbi:helix-turn-helix domain-containing protein [Raoultibacter phocaeensis]|uniref:helix-turn-helix domain-containing protein n=1 Tax=Raoultibacter phocaeensis TaxID=2479841 RepID=UPI0021039FA1|nr:helix-turn-helix transcriptional regulator [Raoultibacter phocaeensis]
MFSIEIDADAQERDVPMMLAPFVRRGERHIDPAWARRWVESRIVPASRQNLGAVLKAHELDSYEPFALLVAAEGRCAQDDFYIREVDDSHGETGEAQKDRIETQGKKVSAEIGAKLAKARIEAGVTQRELSERTGVHQAVISRVEYGRANPTIGLLEDIAAGLGKSIHIEIR